MPDCRGFTIVEVLVSLLILAVGLLGTLSVFGAATRTLAAGHYSIEASARAGEVLEAMRAVGCRGAGTGAEIDGAVTVSWKTDEIGSDLRRVTVVVGSPRVLSRADTFSAVFPC